jgi:hypothetical protein
MPFKDKEKQKQYSKEFSKKYWIKNKEHISQRVKKYRRLNMEKIRLQRKYQYNEAQKEHKRVYRIKRMYGIDDNKYTELLKKQGGVCAICKQTEYSKHWCGKTMKLAIDHDHKTKKVRGLLCSRCNNGIGRFEDSINLLQNAIDYLLINKE